MVGASPNSDIEFNMEEEKDGLQEEYETALLLLKEPQWEVMKRKVSRLILSNIKRRTKAGARRIFGTKPLKY